MCGPELHPLLVHMHKQQGAALLYGNIHTLQLFLKKYSKKHHIHVLSIIKRSLNFRIQSNTKFIQSK